MNGSGSFFHPDIGPKIVLNYPEEDIVSFDTQAMRTLTHEYMYHLLHTDLELRNKLFGYYAGILRKYPQLSEAMGMAHDDLEENQKIYSVMD